MLLLVVVVILLVLDLGFCSTGCYCCCCWCSPNTCFLFCLLCFFIFACLCWASDAPKIHISLQFQSFSPLFSPKTPFFKILIFNVLFLSLSPSSYYYFGSSSSYFSSYGSCFSSSFTSSSCSSSSLFPVSSFILSLTLVLYQSLLKHLLLIGIDQFVFLLLALSF